MLGGYEANKLNPPMLATKFDNDGTWDLRVEDDKWLPVGYIPRRRTRLGWFVYHLWHGLSMHYPWYKVLIFSLLYTRPEYIDCRHWEG